MAILALVLITLLGLPFVMPVTGMNMKFEPLMHPSPRQSERDHMVREQLLARGISDQAVIRAMREVPRHEFVPVEDAAEAYDDPTSWPI